MSPTTSVTPEAAVARLAEIVAARAEFTEDDLYDAMIEAGFSESVTDRAYKFTQTAWGRVFLDGLGIQFSPGYFCLNGTGDIVESGAIADEPYFAAATVLAPRYIGTPGFARFAMMSADVHAINNALNAGSQPEDLVTGPAALFLEPATPEGLEKARQAIVAHLPVGKARNGDAASGRDQSNRVKGNSVTNAPAALAPQKKPWWRLR